MNELSWNVVVKFGDKGLDVKRVQEWLCLNDIYVVIDNEFGPATRAAILKFQKLKGLICHGVVDAATFRALTRSMIDATASFVPQNGLGDSVVRWAARQVDARAREVGGDNCGPWVRLYAKGQDGAHLRWCSAFVIWCIDQAVASGAGVWPVQPSYSCDNLAANAKKVGLWVADQTNVTPGSLFLVKNKANPNDYIHTGIVTKLGADHFESIEGNTNDDGSSNGTGVFRRVRAYDRCDFILV